MVHALGKVITEDRERKRLEKARADCKAKGGVFDEATGTCKLPPKETKEEVEEEPRGAGIGAGRVRVITDEATGEPIGIVRNGITTFLPRNEIENIVRKDVAKFAPIEGGITVEEEIRQRELEKLATRVGELGGTPIGEFQPSELAGTKQTQLVAFKGAADAAINKGLQFAAAGAAAGLIAGPAAPVTVPVAAAIGGE